MKMTQKPKIEAIYPLTFIQQGLLFHHLTSTRDQGFLNVQCDIEGRLDLHLFESACNAVVARHQVMRSTVHWEDLEKPVQIVHQQKHIDLSALDWSAFSKQEQEQQWENLCSDYLGHGAKFQEGPLLTMILVSFDVNNFRLLWPSHHLLIDGWSSNIILKDVFKSYEALIAQKDPYFETVPSHKAYLSWLDRTDVNIAKEFWVAYFKGFDGSHLFGSGRVGNDSDLPRIKKFVLSVEETQALQKLARESKVALNTVLQGLWSLLLSRYFNTIDVVHGTTVSGRSSDFPQVQSLTGMYMNVQPVRNFVSDDQEPISEWFANNQKRQQEALKYEHLGTDEIMNFINRPAGRTLFDSLFIFENFPVVETNDDSVKVSNFKSGLTSTYPITMVVVPSDEMKFEIIALPHVINEKTTSWLLDNFHTIITNLIFKKLTSYADLITQIPVYRSDEKAQENKTSELSKENYVVPSTDTQKELVAIWENLFGISGIGIDDNFFQLGGKSILAVKMFTQLQKKTGNKIAPTILLQNPTIAELSRIIDGVEEKTSWKYLVPLKAKGTKAPLFCIHAGGGHVFFYNELANLVDADRPVYAMQPSGIYKETNMHQSIEQMAIDYVNEIRSVRPEGPYHIMVYCFSTAVGLEMSLRLKKMGQKVNLIVMDTMAEQAHMFTTSRVKMRVAGFFKRLSRDPINVIKIMVVDRFNRRLKPIWIKIFGTAQQQDIEKMRLNLAKIYNTYQWKRHDLKISLILTKKAVKSINDEVLDSWRKIASEGVEVRYTEGNHRTLFEVPDVNYVAKTIDECIDNA